VFCTPEAAPVIKGYGPELIVLPYLPVGLVVGCLVGRSVGRLMWDANCDVLIPFLLPHTRTPE
jgi:hypothetical protein